MATRQQNLDTAIDQITAEIASATAFPKPFYEVFDSEGRPQKQSAVQYLESLQTRLDKLLDLRQRVDEPFIQVSYLKPTY
jgi:hypothetical protein